MRAALGLLKSAVVYWRPGRQSGLRRLYAPFVRPGDVVFDVGAHLGDRTLAFADLGARVVALEPQPRLRRWLERRVGHRDEVTILDAAAGPEAGRATLAVSAAHPTVSTLASEWKDRIQETNPTFRGVRWDETVEVPVVPLDELVQEYGVPAFLKVDVEGYEAEVLRGLHHPVAALSVEFVQGGLDVALDCIRWMAGLGDYRWQAISGEGRSFHFDRWIGAEEALRWVEGGAEGIPSGDLYARRQEASAAAGRDMKPERTNR